MIEQIARIFEQAFPGMTHREIAVSLLVAAAFLALIVNVTMARVLKVKMLADFGLLAFVIALAAAAMRSLM